MHLTLGEAESLSRALEKRAEKIHGIEMVICPSPIFLEPVSRELHFIKLGTQNFYPRESGNFTGETSVLQVAECAEYAIIGHSERRIHLHEDSELIREKIAIALKHHLVPILCVGESAAEKQSGKTFSVLTHELHKCLEQIILHEGDHLIVAYEPVWAISGNASSRAATREEIEKPVSHIQEFLNERFGNGVSQTQIIYGGSTTPENCQEIFHVPGVSGALVGGASLKADSFFTIAKTLSETHI